MKLGKVMSSVVSAYHYKGAVGSPNGHHLNPFKLVHLATSPPPFTFQGSPDPLIIQRPPQRTGWKAGGWPSTERLLVLNIYLIIPF